MRQRKSKRKQAANPRAGASTRPAERPALLLADPPQFEGQTQQGKVIGSLVAIVDHTVEGWALNVEDHTRAVTVDLFDGAHLLGSAAAFMFRSELSAAGIGTGNHYFRFELPECVFDGAMHIISARPTGLASNAKARPVPDPAALAAGVAAPVQAVGMLENVSDDGWVKGWAWYPGEPGRRVEIEILADGVVVGATLAATQRSDLLSAGIGDGNCSFSFGLPPEVLKRPRGALVSIREKATGLTIAEPRLFQRREIQDALVKLADLESDARLLESTVALAAGRGAADKQAAADLFRTVGDFFLQLANVTAAGKPPGSLRTLNAAIEHVTGRFAPIEFDGSLDPALSICVEATGTLDDIYGTLRSIAAIRCAIGIEVALFHTGAVDEAALLPLVARNLRYVHAEEGMTAITQRNRVAESARGRIIVFLAGQAEPCGEWLDKIASVFGSDPTVNMIGAKIIRSDGVLENAGITLGDRRSSAIGLGADPSIAEFSRSRRIDAVDGNAFAVRRDVWLRNRGLDESLESMDVAVIDFCVRSGGGIVYEPQFAVVLRR
jgi:hypothetical protein